MNKRRLLKIIEADIIEWCETTQGIDRYHLSKGENLSGLPYVVADIPPLREHENFLCHMRILFHWGYSFGVHALIQDSSILGSLSEKLKQANKQDLYIWDSENPWERNWHEKIYQPLNIESLKRREKNNIVRIASLSPITESSHLTQQLTIGRNKILGLLG